MDGLFAEAEKRSPANGRLSELKEELRQNTMEKYDDLIAQGRTPEAAYRAAVEGVGDISELLSDVIGESGEVKTPAVAVIPAAPAENAGHTKQENNDDDDDDDDEDGKDGRPPRSRWYSLVSGIIWTVVLCAYFALSFATHAWSVTWLLFIMGIAADNVAKCIFDLRR
jgi:hypothetical protein